MKILKGRIVDCFVGFDDKGKEAATKIVKAVDGFTVMEAKALLKLCSDVIGTASEIQKVICFSEDGQEGFQVSCQSERHDTL